MAVSPIPLSELGRLTGRFHLGESRPLITMKCYFDGSVGAKSDQWMTLGGFIATDYAWARFQKQWEIMLRERYPIAPFIHMTDLITGNDPFERRVGWTEEKIDRLVGDAEAVLASVDTRQMCAFSCSIDVAARKRLIAEGYEISDPALMCAEMGLGHLFEWYDKTHKLELAYLFYDSGEPFIRSIKRRWQKFVKNRKTLVTDQLFWGRIANVQDVSMKDTPGIQAADILAWATTRRLLDRRDDKWGTLANNLIGTRQYSGLLTATQIDPIDEAMMREKHSKR